jgi:hypothetical protein
VTEVAPSTLPPKRLQTGLEAPQHLLTLSSVEDDGLGEELNVIWELEPGARVARARAIPDEIERETAAILARYADPQPRMFAVAVTFLVPERIRKG